MALVFRAHRTVRTARVLRAAFIVAHNRVSEAWKAAEPRLAAAALRSLATAAVLGLLLDVAIAAPVSKAIDSGAEATVLIVLAAPFVACELGAIAGIFIAGSTRPREC